MCSNLIDNLINICHLNHLLESIDEIYVRNQILALLNESEFTDPPIGNLSLNLYETLDRLCDIAVEKNIIDDNLQSRDIFSSNIMNKFLDKPSVINNNFFELYVNSPKSATDWFYDLSKNSNYIKVNRIAKNKSYIVKSPYGNLEITINLSKPEKDPKQIALEKSAPANKYPACLLCVENEGYNGTIKLPDRANHRVIRTMLNNREWAIQYSPYLYYNEHCIVLSAEHVPMKVTKDTFKTLLDFTSFLPHYFVGSNADLPIVGGSILAHEHYQGGNYVFPMKNAEELFKFRLETHKSIKGIVLNWPLSTIRLSSLNVYELTDACNLIFEAWKKYNNSECGILSHSDGTPHNTITPICRRKGQFYEMDLVLRNNRTTEEHPLGIFHPHKEVQHIKKENIGLIEVMGLAILPGRLLTELEDIKDYILEKEDKVASYHKEWADELKHKYKSCLDIDKFIIQELGNKFTTVLEHAGVFKLNEKGIDGFKHFISTL
ncbi:galactose-1-phosphate uridylyltransferase [Candidatus Epulonipiscium fishelsonii]|uniref:Galactose-1-phosphate uridylyltransferase n=1 Tax=Candidatus Epulonipiscium fishelsonii TaxID=77094 RepID=A0ACC8XA50_9FIRM|nr:galactose-1-phosphate uridylyltransferase [Epulopiscium sp. SCG-D08WGA-EpuloA1]